MLKFVRGLCSHATFHQCYPYSVAFNEFLFTESLYLAVNFTCNKVVFLSVCQPFDGVAFRLCMSLSLQKQTTKCVGLLILSHRANINCTSFKWFFYFWIAATACGNNTSERIEIERDRVESATVSDFAMLMLVIQSEHHVRLLCDSLDLFTHLISCSHIYYILHSPSTQKNRFSQIFRSLFISNTFVSTYVQVKTYEYECILFPESQPAVSVSGNLIWMHLCHAPYDTNTHTHTVRFCRPYLDCGCICICTAGCS